MPSTKEAMLPPSSPTSRKENSSNVPQLKWCNCNNSFSLGSNILKGHSASGNRNAPKKFPKLGGSASPREGWFFLECPPFFCYRYSGDEGTLAVLALFLEIAIITWTHTLDSTYTLCSATQRSSDTSVTCTRLRWSLIGFRIEKVVQKNWGIPSINWKSRRGWWGRKLMRDKGREGKDRKWMRKMLEEEKVESKNEVGPRAKRGERRSWIRLDWMLH